MGLAANLFAAAIAYKIGGKAPAIGLFAAGIILMLIVLAAGKKKDRVWHQFRLLEQGSLVLTDVLRTQLVGEQLKYREQCSTV